MQKSPNEGAGLNLQDGDIAVTALMSPIAA